MSHPTLTAADLLDRRQVAAARLWAAERMPYLASAIFATEVRVTAESGTIAVDERWRILVDPAVAATLDVPELGRLVLHLTGHLLRDHATRAVEAGVTAPQTWNRCADAEINDDLPAGTLPATARELPESLGCPPHGLAEGYYAADPTGERLWDCGSGADADPRAYDTQDGRSGSDPSDSRDGGLDPGAAGLLRLSVAAEVARAGREAGTVPGGWLRWAEALVPSRLDWRRVLAAEVRRAVAVVAGNVDYSYRRPSRRGAAALPVVLPTLVRPLPDVAVVCDTSGSMVEELLARALGEVEGILQRGGLPSASLRVLAVDTTVHAVRRVSRAAQVTLAGGGGTDMGAGVAAAAALRPRPGVVVVLTDGFTPWPDRPPRGVRVVVGLLTVAGLPVPPVPDWARTVVITDE